MKKAIVTFALLLLITGIILAFFIQETRIEEGVLDEWDPITPSTLYPKNVTGWAFMVLTTDGTFLELNISASGPVRVRIGTFLTANEVTKEVVWGNIIFDHVGTHFTQKVAIAGTKADFLEIKNEGINPVNISGNIKKLENVRKTFYPYSGLGTLMGFLGSALLIYGSLAKPRKRRLKIKSKKPLISNFINLY